MLQQTQDLQQNNQNKAQKTPLFVALKRRKGDFHSLLK